MVNWLPRQFPRAQFITTVLAGGPAASSAVLIRKRAWCRGPGRPRPCRPGRAARGSRRRRGAAPLGRPSCPGPVSLVRIKRAVLAGRYRFSEKARLEMRADGLTELDVAESIVSRSPFRGKARAYLYVIERESEPCRVWRYTRRESRSERKARMFITSWFPPSEPSRYENHIVPNLREQEAANGTRSLNWSSTSAPTAARRSTRRTQCAGSRPFLRPSKGVPS